MALSVYVADAAAVTAAISMADSIALMRQAFQALAAGRIEQPLRTIIRSDLTAGFLGLMPASVDDPVIYPGAVYGAKLGTMFPDNVRLGKDPHQGVVVLLSGQTGETLAVLDASSVTALRTAAVTGLATDLLARPDASVLALFGTGHQAICQLQAVATVRPLTRVLVVSRDPANARRFAEHHAADFPFVLEPGTAAAALAAADIVVTATNSATPVFERASLRPGTHITAMGASTPAFCEIDGATMACARLFVDRAESTRAESGEFRNAVRDGFLAADVPLIELADLVTGRQPGRISADEITLFKSLGLALEDVVVAAALRRRHELHGQGQCVTL